MGQNPSLLRIVVCTVFISLQFFNQILFHGNWGFCNFSMVSAVLFLIIKILCFHHYFHFPCLFLCHFIYLVSFVVLSFYLTIWFLQGWFLLRVKVNMRSSSWYFVFPSSHVLYILSGFYFKLFFFCIFMTCRKSLYIFCSVAYKWSFVCTTVLYSTFLRINKDFFWGENK